MKKIFLLLLVVSLILGLTSCFSLADTTQEMEEDVSKVASSKAGEDEKDNEETGTPQDIVEEVEVESEEENDDLEFEVGASIRQGDIEITIVNVGIFTQEEMGYDEDPADYIALGIMVENYNKEETFSVYADQGVLVTDTGEMIDCDMYNSDDVGGDILAEVIIDGVIVFPLKYTMPNEIMSFKYYVTAPTDENWDRIGEMFEFEIQVEMPDYQPVSREVILDRIYESFKEQASDSSTYSIMYETDIVEQTGTITVHIPVVAMVDDYENYEGDLEDYILVPMIIENSSNEMMTFYSSQAVLTTNTKEQLEDDMFMGSYIEADLYGQVYVTGSNAYLLERSDISEITEIKLTFSGPVDDDWNDMGEDLKITIPLN